MHRALTFILLAGCFGQDDVEDTGLDEDTVVEDEYEWEPCGTVSIDHIGPDDPIVGDSWTVWLYCDNALLMGPQVLRFDPTNFAIVEEDNLIVFRREGTGTLRMQVGAEWAEEDITVGPKN